jgi:hypothetical protein
VSAVQKAADFIALLKENGWKGKLDLDEKNDWAKIFAHRDQERLEIGWCVNQLIGPPKYEFAGTIANLHSAAVARQHVRASKPDMSIYLKRKRRKVRAVQRANQNNSSSAPEEFDTTQHELPFDIHESTDKEILRAIRGSTIIWKNTLTGMPESEYVPREMNRDLNNTFYVAESSEGRAYVSFMTSGGVFRAVALEQILQVR